MNKRTLVAAALVAALTSLFVEGLKSLPAEAHTGSPAMVTWSTGQTLTSTDLNNAFAHVHNTLSGGISDSNINAAAGISHSKLATPALVTKAWGVVGSCNSAITGSCTVDDSSMVTSVTTTSTTGLWNVTLNYTPANTNFGILVLPIQNTASNGPICWVPTRGTSSPHFQIRCETNAAVALGTLGFAFAVFDS